MSKTVIRVENVSKQYRLGKVGTGSLAHDLNRWWCAMRGKEDPYSKVGDVNDRSTKGSSDYVWSLRNLNFDIKQGEALGIIGHNGAGKSTLLKILSRTTAPTLGKVKVRGRVASLLEVGTGFHPELTGRENVYLNGAILGMTKSEIRQKFDEIVDFAGVERYVDTPVKRYSSGMYVRLAFGVAAHLEPDILIVDEVLAVGDAEFQKKALGKMNDVSKNQGRTVLFVSHNISSIKALCGKGILLENGQLKFAGTSEDTIAQYVQSAGASSKGKAQATYSIDKDKPVQLTGAAVLNQAGEPTALFDLLEDIYLKIGYEIRSRRGGIAVALRLIKGSEVIFASFDTDNNPGLLQAREPGAYTTRVRLPQMLKAGEYTLTFHITLLRADTIDIQENTIGFVIDEKNLDTTYKSFAEKRDGLVMAQLDWNTHLSSIND